MAATKRKNSIPLADTGIDWSSPVGEPEVTRTAPEPEQEQPSGMLRRTLGDTGVSLVKSAMSVPETFVGMADMVTGGHAGKLVEGAGVRFKDANAAMDELYSPEYKAASKKVQEADGIVDTLKAAFANPSTIYHGAVTSMGSMLAGAPVGRAAAALRAPGWLAGGLAEGASSAGQNLEQVRQESKDGLVTGEQAAIIGASGLLTAGITSVAGRIANKLGIGDINQMIAGAERAGPEVQKGLARKLLEGFATEGVLQEFPQSAQEQVAQNIAQGKPWDQGVANAAVMGGLSGGLLGAGSAPFGGHGPAVVHPAATPLLPDTGPMSRAANAATIAARGKPLDFTPTTIPPKGDALAVKEAPDTTALDFEADPRFASAIAFPNGKAPAQPLFANKQLADVHIGEQGAFGELEPVEAGGQWTVQQTPEAANRTSRANIEKWMEQAQPMEEAQAKDMAKRAESELNKPMTALPMPDGEGWTVVPRQWVSAPVLVDYTERAAAAAQARGEQEAETNAARESQAARVQEAANAPVDRTPRTPRADAVEIDPAAPNAVAQFIAQQATINTPAARAFVQDYRAGRVTDADVLARITPKPQTEATPDERLAAAAKAGQVETDSTPSLILNREGKPFKSEFAAAREQKKHAGSSVVAVEGGHAVQPAPVESPDAQAAVAPEVITPIANQEEAHPASAGAPAAGEAGGAGDKARSAGAVEADGVKPSKSAIQRRNRLKADRDAGWTAFAADSGTKGIPRADMPQIAAEHRGAMVNFLNARGIAHEQAEVSAADLKPTQAEYSKAKVEKAKAYEGGDRSILVSSDGHVLDGHHQWLAKHDAGATVKVIRLDAPIDKLLAEVREFPSADTSEGVLPASEPVAVAKPQPAAEEGAKSEPSDEPDTTATDEGSADMRGADESEAALPETESVTVGEPAQRPTKQAVSEAPPSKTPAVDAHFDLIRTMNEGAASVEDYRAGFKAVVEGEQEIKGQLNKLTKDKLTDTLGPMFMRRPGETKADIVNAVYGAIVRQYAMGKEYGPTGYMMGERDSYEAQKAAALAELVQNQTADDLAAYAAERKHASEERAAARASVVEAVKNPKTLDDYRRYFQHFQQEGMTFQQIRMALTPEQRAAYDELAADFSRSKRKTTTDEQRTQVRVAGQTVDGDIIATKHTKKGTDLFVVRLAERVGREDYDTLNAGAKRIGGYYSSFRGAGAVPGFQFTTREQAEAFVTLAGGDNTAAVEVAKERRDAFADDRSQTAAERLTEMAGRLEERADESLGRERKANTERRARFAASAEASANADKAMAKTMRNLAEAITAGKAKFLDRVRQKTQVEMLQSYVGVAKNDELRMRYPTYAEMERHQGETPTGETADYAEFPTFTAYRSDLASLGRQLLEVEGTKKLGLQIMKVADDMSDAFTAFAKEPGNLFKLSTFSVRAGDEVRTAIFTTRDAAEAAIKRSRLSAKAIVFPEKRGVNRIIMSPSEAIAQGIWKGDGDKRIGLDADFGAELVEKIGKANRRGSTVSVPWQFERAHDRRKALARMGIETPAEFRAALREFIGLREQPAALDKVKQLERALIGRRNDGFDFFPTPESTADEMVSAADIQPGMKVAEPSAGMGHIADRIRAAGVEPDVVEIESDKRELLEAKGYNLIGRDFLDLTEGGYDRIVMNPPFSDGRDIKHVRHAFDLLAPGGRLVALMGESAFTNQNKRATEFREWLDAVGGTEEKLSEGTFNDRSLPVNTGANARMVVVDKSDQAEVGGPAFSRSKSVERPRVTVEHDDSGLPVYIGDKVRLEFPQVTERLEVIETDGEQVVNYPIMSATGFDVLGYVELLVQDGQAKALLDIEVDKKGRQSGVARNVVEALLAANPSASLDISNVVPEARGFWEKMGIPQQNVEGAYDGNLTWKTYAAAQNTRAEVRAAGSSQGSREGAATGAESGVDRTSQPAREDEGAQRLKAVKALAGRITARWKNAPEVIVLSGMNDPLVPRAARLANQSQLSQGAQGEPEGFLHAGKVYLIAPQLRGDMDVMRVLFHESLGHFGLRGTFGAELGTILDRLAVLNAGKVRAKAKQYGLDYDKPSDRRMAAEEVLAEMAQRAPDVGWAKKAVAAIRTWLREHVPGFSKMTLTDAEIVRSFILPARAFVQRGNATSSAESGEAAFSRSTIADAVTNFSQAGARNAFLDAVTTHGSTNFWGRTVGTQYHKAQTNPTTFGRVFDAVQSYIADTSVFANRAADLAPSLLPKLDTMRDLVKQGVDPADKAKAGEAIFQGTLDKVLYDDATLKSQFGLSAKQIGLYREFRAAVDQSLEGLAKTEILRVAGEAGRAVRDAVLAAPTAREAAEILNAHITGDSVAGVADPEGTAAEISSKVDRIEQLQGEGYAPLTRFGKHTLHVTGPGGGTEFFGMYETVRDANRAARQLRADPTMANLTFTQGVMSQEGHKLFNGLSMDSLELFADATGNSDNPVYQAYMKLAIANRSALKRMIERKGIAGYSDDVARVLASFVTSNARMSAGHLHLTDAKKSAEAIPKEQGDLRDDAIKLVEYVTTPTEEAAAMRGLLFTSFIGGSVASALVNMTQPITMTLPFLTQYGGALKAGKRLTAAIAMVASGKGMDAGLAEALKRAESDGIVSPQEIHHLQAEAMNTLGKNPLLKKAAFVWGSMFSLAEQFNRRATFVAAYQTAQQEGMANPFAFAEKAVIETQGLYNKGNKANVARGAVGATVMTFKQFSTHYLEFLVRMWKSGPEGKKAVAVALALLMLMGGAGGLPFADDLDDIIDTLGQAMGHDTNAKRWKRQFISQTLGLGDGTADVATRGLTALPGFPLDLSLRMGMGNLLPATGLFLRSNTDTAKQLLEVAGAAGGLASNIKDGVTKVLGGDLAGGAMSAMPMAVQNMAKAIQMAQTGEYRNGKGAKVMDVSATDAAMKFIGFQPAEVARESGRVGEAMRSIQLAKNVEGEIAGRWAQAMVDGDSDGVKKARESLAEWNAANPTAPIKITLPQVLARVKALRSSRADRTVKAAPKEMRGTVREAMS